VQQLPSQSPTSKDKGAQAVERSSSRGRAGARTTSAEARPIRSAGEAGAARASASETGRRVGSADARQLERDGSAGASRRGGGEGGGGGEGEGLQADVNVSNEAPPVAPIVLASAAALEKEIRQIGASLEPKNDWRQVGSPLPHLHQDWARPCHTCTGACV
jgi:hypothetical protein